MAGDSPQLVCGPADSGEAAGRLRKCLSFNLFRFPRDIGANFDEETAVFRPPGRNPRLSLFLRIEGGNGEPAHRCLRMHMD